MAYPLIILGAGASYDYSSFGRPCPITNQLVDDEYFHPDLANKYKGSGNILSEIIQQIKLKKRNFEEILTEIKEQTKHSQAMKIRLNALEFYLKEVFERFSTPNDHNQKIHNANNYQILINRIDTYAGGRALVATFNYDSLFERNLSYGLPKKMNDYIANNIKIFKFHGSHDWVYIHRKSAAELIGLEIKDGFDLCTRNPDIFDKIKTYNPVNETELLNSGENDNFLKFPALAIPLTGKDRYILPKDHLVSFEEHLPKIDRVLIVGWRAADQLLLETMEKHLQKMGYKVFIVSNSDESARLIAKIIKNKLGIINPDFITTIPGGFSRFLSDDISKAFFTS